MTRPVRGDELAEVAMPTMLGLASVRLRVALAVLIGAYLFVRCTDFTGARTGFQWLLEAAGAVGLTAALLASAHGDRDPLPRMSAAGIAGVSTAALVAAWWALPLSAGHWVQPGAPLVVFAVTAGLLTLRGRAPLAWVACVVAVVFAAWWSVDRGGTLVAGGQITLRIAASLLPATLMAVLIRPMVRLTGVLEDRRADLLERAAATTAVLAERRDRMLRFDRDVRPYLRQVADGATFDEAEATRARLLELDLRDETRGRTWYSPTVKVAIERARMRTVQVRLLDDGGEEHPFSEEDRASLRSRLVDVLDHADAGAVTARILPPGRDHVAVINVVTVDRVTRSVLCSEGGDLAWQVTEGVDLAE
ncbi:hypothetical protein [Gordonia zhaorongruii]|uniref:hypothetical protein n=1 Tax=Gordonia zhaorongruii TaxID=2597659 RepID=UPI001048321D|nr:hypothetical protein [Gordonia zhaorongruii]